MRSPLPRNSPGSCGCPSRRLPKIWISGRAAMRPVTRALFAIGLGVILATSLGVVIWLVGLAGNNWRTIPAWTIAGALIGAAHPTAELLLWAFQSLGERLERRWARRGERSEPEPLSERKQWGPADPGTAPDREGME